MAAPNPIKLPLNRNLLGVCVWEEKLGAAWLKLLNGSLAAWTDNPIDEGLCIAEFHSGMFRRVNCDDAILIMKSYIAFDENLVITLIPKTNPRSAI